VFIHGWPPVYKKMLFEKFTDHNIPGWLQYQWETQMSFFKRDAFDCFVNAIDLELNPKGGGADMIYYDLCPANKKIGLIWDKVEVTHIDHRTEQNLSGKKEFYEVNP